MNPFYQGAPNMFAGIGQMVGQVSQDPIGFLARAGLNIPGNVGKDSNSIIQYMLNSGRITQDQLNWAIQKAREIQH